MGSALTPDLEGDSVVIILVLTCLPNDFRDVTKMVPCGLPPCPDPSVLLSSPPCILRVYVECAARLYGDPREAGLIKIHLHSRKLTFHYYRDFDTTPLPELLTRIKIDLKRLFVTVIDHTNGREHQLLFF